MQFQNTKSDIGNCPKRYHEEKLREAFLAEGERYREEYQREFMHLLEKLVNDLERRLRRGRDRLEVKPSDPTAVLNPVSDELEEKRTILDLQIKELLAKIEAAGEEGRIQEAQDLMAEVERYRGDLDRLRHLEAENPTYRLEKRMEVCSTCGAFLIVGDAQKRIEAHFEGRQHNGWARIRDALAELKGKFSAPAATGSSSGGGGGYYDGRGSGGGHYDGRSSGGGHHDGRGISSSYPGRDRRHSAVSPPPSRSHHYSQPSHHQQHYAPPPPPPPLEPQLQRHRSPSPQREPGEIDESSLGTDRYAPLEDGRYPPQYHHPDRDRDRPRDRDRDHYSSRRDRDRNRDYYASRSSRNGRDHHRDSRSPPRSRR